MKKPSSRIRQEIAKLQEQLKLAETREAERIGRIALRAGLGDIEIEETDLQAALENLTKNFRARSQGSAGNKATGEGPPGPGSRQSGMVAPGAAAGSIGEA